MNSDQMFDAFDIDRQGDIDINEMRQGLARSFKRPSVSEAEQIFAAIDYDKSGDISREEWNERFERNVRRPCSKQGRPQISQRSSSASAPKVQVDLTRQSESGSCVQLWLGSSGVLARLTIWRRRRNQECEEGGPVERQWALHLGRPTITKRRETTWKKPVEPEDDEEEDAAAEGESTSSREARSRARVPSLSEDA